MIKQLTRSHSVLFWALFNACEKYHKREWQKALDKLAELKKEGRCKHPSEIERIHGLASEEGFTRHQIHHFKMRTIALEQMRPILSDWFVCGDSDEFEIYEEITE